MTASRLHLIVHRDVKHIKEARKPAGKRSVAPPRSTHRTTESALAPSTHRVALADDIQTKSDIRTLPRDQRIIPDLELTLHCCFPHAPPAAESTLLSAATRHLAVSRHSLLDVFTPLLLLSCRRERPFCDFLDVVLTKVCSSLRKLEGRDMGSLCFVWRSFAPKGSFEKIGRKQC
jgi:hypothetical protein